MAETKMTADATNRQYLIWKQGAYYRPKSQGYTRGAINAGRYTLSEAESITHPNGPDGPRDGMFYVHEDEVIDEDWTAYQALRTQLAESRAQTAAAYGLAAKVANDRGAYEQQAYGLTKGVQDLYRLRDAIRALTPADAKDALDKMLADARADAIREAAVVAYQFEGNDKLRCLILSKIGDAND